MFDDLPPPPDGFTLDPVTVNPPPAPPLSRAPRLVPVSNAYAIAQGVYPGIQITDWRRDPNSRLGRENPGSWHVRSSAAIDARPLPGMTFDQYVQGFRDAGFQPLEAIDEVHHPSRHATGPHWHLALGYDPNSPPLDPTANMREQSGDAPLDSLPPPPAGFALDAPTPPHLLNLAPPALPGGPGLNASVPPPNAGAQAAVQSLAPPLSTLPRFTDPLAFNRAGVQAQNQALTASAPPPPSGYQADPSNVASQFSAPANRVPTAQTTTRDDPRLAGFNDQVRSLAMDPNVSNDELTSVLVSHGVTRANMPGWDALMAWRAAPASAGPQRSLAAWRQLPARQRGRQGVNLDDIALPAGQYREVTTPGNVPQAQATEYHPPLTEQVAHVLSAPDRALSSDPRNVIADEQQRAAMLQNPLSPVQALQDAQEANDRSLRAQVEGRPLAAQGDQAQAAVASLGVIPIVGRSRAGVELAGKALAEVESLAARYGAREAGPAADAVIARIATERFGELSPETQSALIDLARPAAGEAAPTAIAPAHIGDLRIAANPPPSMLQRGAQAIRDRLGRREAPPRVPDRIDIGAVDLNQPPPLPSPPPTPEIQTSDGLGTFGREQYNQRHGNLWLAPLDQLDTLHDQAKRSEADQLRRAIDMIGLQPSERLSRTLSSDGFNWDRAAAMVEREAQAAGHEIPEAADRLLNPRWDDPPQSDLPMSEDIAELQRAHAAAADNDPHMLSSEIGWALRDLTPEDMASVIAGHGTPAAQARMVTVRLGVQRLTELGTHPDAIPQMLAQAMVNNGVKPSDAAELAGNAVEMMRAGGRPRAAPERLALSGPEAPAPVPAHEHGDPFNMSQAEHDDLMDLTPEERGRHAREAWIHFRAREIGPANVSENIRLQRAAEEAAQLEAHGRAPWVGREDELINRLMDEIAPEWREPDRIDVASVRLPPAKVPADVSGLPPPPPGFTLEDPLGRVPPLGEQPTAEAMADVARSIRPEDVVPVPSNRIQSEAEAVQANPGTFRKLGAPDPATMLEMRSVQRWDGRTVRFRGPLDAETYLRSRGGIADTDGELRHIGITNNYGRPDAPGEARLGPIVHPGGMPLDEAGRLLHEAGYLHERPTTADVVDILRESRLGRRLWHPEDLGEVAGYEGAQAQGEAVDAAEQAGAPLVERIGSPVGPADLTANNPPAVAYEDLPNIGGKVGNINLAHIESNADISRLLDTVEQRFGGFDAARRGVITHAETEKLAGELGMTVDDLLRRRRGQALNAEQALAARQLLAKSSDEVIALAAKATGPEASDVSRAAFSEALLRHAAIHEQVTGAISEAGRALSAMRAAARARAISGNIHQAAVDGIGGQKRLEEVAEKILELHQEGVGPGQVNRFAVRATQPRFRDKLVELWYNSLLSGPRTHAVNILSNMMTAALQIPEHATAAAIGLVRRGAGALFGKADDFDRVLASEIGQRTFGLMQGTGEGLRAFGRTLRTGDVADHVTKVEARTQHAISGLKGSILRTPTRALAAEDEFFKAIGRRMELNGLAVRQARSEGLRGQALRDRIADLSTNPTDDMVAKSMDYARYVTFQRPLQQGSAAQHLQRMTQNNPWMKLFIPFVRTPANLLKFAVERSPAGLLLKSVRADIAAGGARRDLAMARMMLGTGLAMTVADLAHRGMITGGGPADHGALDLMRGDGWQPYSIKINGTYYSYARMDPISTTIGVAADMVDFNQHMTPGQRAQAGPLLVASMIRNLGNKTWLSGVADVVSAIDDPQRFGPSLIARLGASIAVPAIVSQTAGVLDPTMRDTHAPTFSPNGAPQDDSYGFLSTLYQTAATIQSRLPGVSQNLPARRDVWGQPITREGSLGPDMLSPFSTSTARNDPITAELLSLGASIGHPAQQMRGVHLSPEQAAGYAETSGRYIRDDLRAALADPSWRDMDAGERLREIGNIKRTARADARADLGLDGSGPASAPAALPPPPPGFTLSH